MSSIWLSCNKTSCPSVGPSGILCRNHVRMSGWLCIFTTGRSGEFLICPPLSSIDGGS
jgi:hypothetical protein